MSTAKNVILAGVKSVTVYDPEPVEIQDLSSQVCGLVLRGHSYSLYFSSFCVKRTLESLERKQLLLVLQN